MFNPWSERKLNNEIYNNLSLFFRQAFFDTHITLGWTVSGGAPQPSAPQVGDRHCRPNIPSGRREIEADQIFSD